MPGGFPQTIGVIAGMSSGGVAALPFLVVPSGDGQTGILQVGGVAATIGFPFSFSTDNQAASSAAGVGVMGWDGANVDRIRVANVGVDAGAGATGALVVQGSLSGSAVPVATRYTYLLDAQAPLANSGMPVLALNASGTVDRLRVANTGTDLGLATTGVLVVQGSSHGTPIPVSGSFVASYPYSEAADAQTATIGSSLAIMGYDPILAHVDRIKTAAMGSQIPNATAGVLVVQSSPSAAPFPMASIGIGSLFAVPAGSANGTAIGVVPAGAQGVRIYVPPGASLTYAVASSAPVAPPTTVPPFTNPSTSNFPIVVDENLSGSQNLYITAPTIANAALVARFM